MPCTTGPSCTLCIRRLHFCGRVCVGRSRFGVGGLAAHLCAGGSGIGVDIGMEVGAAATDYGLLLWVCPTG